MDGSEDRPPIIKYSMSEHEKLRIARRAIARAARVFRLYADLQRSRGNPTLEREALENTQLALEMESALAQTETGSTASTFIQNDL